ncbi:major facilitator superfamily domain-containing protein [Bombardia bombarda]|uniref:Major facilitator superfamily domain-containing protein n=1 Tax=Bombardia bombarda TaxID=252184 RepID=A0AA40C409_9PEZI|nr:major facilitator superfamily domain-containing protein [Bombardia bombarda]
MTEAMDKSLGSVSASISRQPSQEKLAQTSDDGPELAVTGSQLESEQYLSGIQLFLVLSSMTLAIFLVLMDASIVATATPKITGDFHSLDDIGWYGTAYLLAKWVENLEKAMFKLILTTPLLSCVLQPLSGKIYTYFTVKITFLAFFAVFEAGSALCGAAVSSNMLIIGRAVAGLGASGLLNGGYTMLTLIVPEDKQARYRGILMGLSFFGILAGPLIGGALTEYTTWRWCFYINLPAGAVIALGLILIPFPESQVMADGPRSLRQKLQKLDLIGFLLFTPTVIMLILALQWGGIKHPWSSATIIGLFCGALGNLLVFLAWEHHMGAEAMIPLSLIRRRIIWSSCLNQAFFIGCTFITSYYFPVYFQAVQEASPVQSGVGMLPQIVTNMVVTIATGVLVTRLGYYLPFALASGVFTSIGAGLVSTLTPTSATSRRVGFQILQGFQGLGIQMPILAVQNAVRKEEAPVASALVVFSQNLGGAVFLSIAEVIFSNRLRHFLSEYAPSADAAALVRAGASAADIKAAVPAELLPAVKLAYSNTFDQVMYLGTGAAGGAFLVAWGMAWVRINTQKNR